MSHRGRSYQTDESSTRIGALRRAARVARRSWLVIVD
jgi:hypothetical protein